MSDNNGELLKKVDIRKIAEDGAKIYKQVKVNYDPKEKGKFLAIEIENEKIYLGNTSAEAMELARQNHPDKVFYIVKIGYDTAETLAQFFTSN